MQFLVTYWINFSRESSSRSSPDSPRVTEPSSAGIIEMSNIFRPPVAFGPRETIGRPAPGWNRENDVSRARSYPVRSGIADRDSWEKAVPKHASKPLIGRNPASGGRKGKTSDQGKDQFFHGANTCPARRCAHDHDVDRRGATRAGGRRLPGVFAG